MFMKIIQGYFTEGETVTVEIKGAKITRKVHYDAQAGDLFVWYKGSKYFYYEFE